MHSLGLGFDSASESDFWIHQKPAGALIEAYIDHICKELPNVSREEIIRRNPDPATGEAGPATDDNIRDNPPLHYLPVCLILLFQSQSFHPLSLDN